MGRHLVPGLPGSRRTPRSCPPCEIGPSLPVARRFSGGGALASTQSLPAVPAVERELCGHLVLGKRLAINAVRLRVLPSVAAERKTPGPSADTATRCPS